MVHSLHFAPESSSSEAERSEVVLASLPLAGLRPLDGGSTSALLLAGTFLP